MTTREFYKDWCRKAGKGGGVLIGKSIQELLTAHQEHLRIKQTRRVPIYENKEIGYDYFLKRPFIAPVIVDYKDIEI